MRIRSLQDHLQQARGWLQQIKDTNAGPVAGLDLDECLRSLDFTIPDDSPSSPPPMQLSASHDHERTLERHHNMLMGHDRFMQKAPGGACFYGAYSDISFILRTMELLKLGPPESQNQWLCIMSDLLSRPLHPCPESLDFGASIYDLPMDADALLDAVFTRGDLMLCFLVQQPLRDAAVDPQSTSISKSYIQLLHLVLALGYLYSFREHGGDLCDDAVRKATKHFHICMTMGLPGFAQDLVTLQSVLCAVIFLFSGYRTAMAHSLIGTACSSALRLGLLSPSYLDSATSAEEQKTRMRLVGVVLATDMLGSLILDLPPFIHHESIPHSRLLELAVRAEAEGDLRTAALLRQSSLLAIPLSTRKHGAGHIIDDQFDAGNIRAFQKAIDECQHWRRDASPLIAKLGQDPNHLW